jgi:hypothetical protein
MSKGSISKKRKPEKGIRKKKEKEEELKFL